MQWKSLSVVDGAYQDETRAWSVQDCVNFLPTPTEQAGTSSPSILRTAPGLTQMADTSELACRGLHQVQGVAYGVFGDHLYKIESDGAIASKGSIPGVGRVSMAHNQIALGSQLVIANSYGAAYVYNTVDETLTHITSDGFPGAVDLAFMDGYIIGVDPSRHFVFHSQIADALTYNSLDHFQAEALPDLIRGIATSNGRLWVFGDRSIQPFINRGSSGFAPSSGSLLNVGCANCDTIVTIGGTLAWLADDGSVRMANGYQAQRISTRPLEQAISNQNWDNAHAFAWEDRGHIVYYLTFRDGQTWGFDMAAQKWHRRQSYELDKWRVNDLVRAYGKWFAGDYANGKLYHLDWDTVNENGAPLERRRTMGYISDNGNRVVINGFRLSVQTGSVQPPALGISGYLPSTGCGSTVSYKYGANGGTAPYTFYISNGQLPDGLSMSRDGTVTGEIANGGDYSWTVTAEDAFYQKTSLVENRSGNSGFYAYLTSQLYPVFVQDDADSPVLTGGSTDKFYELLEPIAEGLLTGGQTDQFDMEATVIYSTYDHAQDDADSPTLAGGSTDTFDMKVVVSYSTYAWAQDDADSPSLTGGKTDQFAMAVVAGYQTYDWKQDDADSPSLTGGKTDQFTMTTV